MLGGLAACWLVVGLSAWRNRRRDIARRMPLRWHRAVTTLSAWSAGDANDPPAGATWCRPLVQPVVFAKSDLPQQRTGATDAAAELSGSPRR